MSTSSQISEDVKTIVKDNLGPLYQYMAQRLSIKHPPRIILSYNREYSLDPFGLTGFYDPINKTITLFIINRHPTDILRTFAHEIIHHWQNERGTLTPSTTSHEHYAQKDPVLRQREKEAYLLGNIIFRDFRDIYKS